MCAIQEKSVMFDGLQWPYKVVTQTLNLSQDIGEKLGTKICCIQNRKRRNGLKDQLR